MLTKPLLTIIGLTLLLGTACNKDRAFPAEDDTKDKVYSLSLIESYALQLREPSGLSPTCDGQQLVVVSDNSNKAYVIDTNGHTIKELNYTGFDTEGITVDCRLRQYWIAEEGKAMLVQLDSNGNKLSEYPIDLNPSSPNKGLEGLSYDEQSQQFYVLNEAEPGLLVKWSPDAGIKEKITLSFAMDYSGVYYAPVEQQLWIVSDRSQKLFLCDTLGNMLQSFPLPFDKAEGIVLDEQQHTLYIVSDSQEKLYHYKIEKK